MYNYDIKTNEEFTDANLVNIELS